MMKSLKILCLHGFRQNTELLKKSMESTIKKLLRLNIEFDFYDSPIKYSNGDDETSNYRQWWSASRENILTSEKYDTIDQSLVGLKNKWESNKYDGILGFSQGSVLTQIFAYQIQNKIITIINEPKFLILVGAFSITDNNYKEYYQKQLKYKTLIITGSKDTLVKMEITLQLVKYFENSSTIIHKGGHYFSNSSETYYLLRNFLQEIMK